MAKPRKGDPRVWITWVSGLMADDDHCRYAAWFKARFTYEKAESDFDKADYRTKHKLARDARVAELRADGWQVKIEGEVDFVIKGKGVTLAGKPDIVAIKPDQQRILIEDPKTGQKYMKHWYQLAVYMRWIRNVLSVRYSGYTVEGALLYYAVEEGVPRLVERIEVAEAELTPAVRECITLELQTVGMDLMPEKTPSPQECLYCDIAKSECPEKAAERAVPVEVDDF